MTVETLYFSSHDGLDNALANPEIMMFTSKKAADERDKMLDFAMYFAEYMKRRLDTEETEMLENIGLVIAENAALFRKAMKKPEILDDNNSMADESGQSSKEGNDGQRAGIEQD